MLGEQKKKEVVSKVTGTTSFLFIPEIYCSFSVTNVTNQMVRQDNGKDHTMGSTISNGKEVNRQGRPNNRSQTPSAEDSLA